MKFIVNVDNEDQERDLRERAEANHLTPAEMIARQLYNGLFQKPIEVEEVEE